MKAVIIGAGVSGLACAIRLRALGLQVSFVEQNNYVGGKLSGLQIDAFRFDAGPSVFTLPQEVLQLFELSGESSEEHFRFTQLDVSCRYFWPDGTRLTAWADREKFAQEIEQISAVPEAKVEAFLDRSAEIFNTTESVFLDQSLHRLSSFFNKNTIRSLTKFGKIDAFQSMNAVNQSLFKNDKIVQLFNRFATYNGSNPYKAPATLNLIPHLEHNIGAFIPEGGMNSISESLFELAKRKGVQFRFSKGVEKIAVKNGAVQGVICEGELEEADLLISAIDVRSFYKNILQDQSGFQKLQKQELSSSALVFYWGIGKTYPELDLHNILFSAEYEKEFECLFEKDLPFEDPTVYINITKKYVDADAPEGKENWFVMINVPSSSNTKWEHEIAGIRKIIIDKINRQLNTDLEKWIECEQVLHPGLIESKTSSFQGALYGNSSNSKWTAFRRHPNFHPTIKGLYFAGGSVHPGGGIPLCLKSAKIVEQLIRADYSDLGNDDRNR